MGLKQFFASQLRKPSGWFGSLLLSRLMNLSNRQLISSTLAALELNPQHHVLEIGFGGGLALSRLCGLLTSGVAWGVDYSPEMVRRAERKFHREIAAGRIRVQLGEVSRLPFPDIAFDRVFTINTIYFWPDALQGLSEIRRVLKNDCLAAVSLRSREKMQRVAFTKHGFHLFEPQEVADLMRQAGFSNVRVDWRDRDKLYDDVIVVATR